MAKIIYDRWIKTKVQLPCYYFFRLSSRFSNVADCRPFYGTFTASLRTSVTGAWGATVLGHWRTAESVPLWSSRGRCCCQDRDRDGRSPVSEWWLQRVRFPGTLTSSTFPAESLFSACCELRRRRAALKRRTSHLMPVRTACLQCHKLGVEVRYSVAAYCL